MTHHRSSSRGDRGRRRADGEARGGLERRRRRRRAGARLATTARRRRRRRGENNPWRRAAFARRSRREPRAERRARRRRPQRPQRPQSPPSPECVVVVRVVVLVDDHAAPSFERVVAERGQVPRVVGEDNVRSSRLHERTRRDVGTSSVERARGHARRDPVDGERGHQLRGRRRRGSPANAVRSSRRRRGVVSRRRRRQRRRRLRFGFDAEPRGRRSASSVAALPRRDRPPRGDRALLVRVSSRRTVDAFFVHFFVAQDAHARAARRGVRLRRSSPAFRSRDGRDARINSRRLLHRRIGRRKQRAFRRSRRVVAPRVGVPFLRAVGPQSRAVLSRFTLRAVAPAHEARAAGPGSRRLFDDDDERWRRFITFRRFKFRFRRRRRRRARDDVLVLPLQRVRVVLVVVLVDDDALRQRRGRDGRQRLPQFTHRFEVVVVIAVSVASLLFLLLRGRRGVAALVLLFSEGVAHELLHDGRGRRGERQREVDRAKVARGRDAAAAGGGEVLHGDQLALEPLLRLRPRGRFAAARRLADRGLEPRALPLAQRPRRLADRVDPSSLALTTPRRGDIVRGRARREEATARRRRRRRRRRVLRPPRLRASLRQTRRRAPPRRAAAVAAAVVDRVRVDPPRVTALFPEDILQRQRAANAQRLLRRRGVLDPSRQLHRLAVRRDRLSPRRRRRARRRRRPLRDRSSRLFLPHRHERLHESHGVVRGVQRASDDVFDV
eukprot:31317-Pelagococcus_subviridis.AAC.2